jgi:hypothetical protein
MRHPPNVRVDGLPLVVAVPSAPELPPGSRIRLSLNDPDLLELSVQSRFESVLSNIGGDSGEDLELLDEVPVEEALAEAEEAENDDALSNVPAPNEASA